MATGPATRSPVNGAMVGAAAVGTAAVATALSLLDDVQLLNNSTPANNKHIHCFFICSLANDMIGEDQCILARVAAKHKCLAYRKAPRFARPLAHEPRKW